MLNTLTPFIVVRNLRRRADRLENMHKRMESINTTFFLQDAVDDKNTSKSACWWNAQNGLMMIRYAKAANLDSILLLDDDCVFIDNFNQILKERWPLVPDNWDIVSFGEIYGQAEEVVPGVVRCFYTWGGHASLIRKTVYDRVLETVTGNTWADEELNFQLKKEINYYAFKPYLITQEDGYSDLKNEYVRNGHFE